jgi:hypothetical protein
MYIDPSSGGMLFQALLVVFGVISGTVLLFSSKIKMGFARFMRTIREKSSDDQSEENGSENE